MNTRNYTKIQVPLKTSIKKKAEEVAEDYGYSSLQEVIRIFLTSFSKGDIQLLLTSPNTPEYISSEFEEYLNQKRTKIEEEIRKGTQYIAYSGEDIVEAARSFKNEEKD